MSYSTAGASAAGMSGAGVSGAGMSGAGMSGAGASATGMPGMLATEEEAESSGIKQGLSELVQTEPASMTRTLQAWLREDQV